MGQQQLLLLVLGIVIVGIAVVAGIAAFTEGKGKADRDAAATDAMRLVSDLQAWKLRPTVLGGGADGTTSFANVSLRAIGIAPTSGSDVYATASGCFKLVAGATAQLQIWKEGSNCTGSGNQLATVTISDATTSGLSWAYN
jgi:hypothetical protein